MQKIKNKKIICSLLTLCLFSTIFLSAKAETVNTTISIPYIASDNWSRIEGLTVDSHLYYGINTNISVNLSKTVNIVNTRDGSNLTTDSQLAVGDELIVEVSPTRGNWSVWGQTLAFDTNNYRTNKQTWVNVSDYSMDSTSVFAPFGENQPVIRSTDSSVIECIDTRCIVKKDAPAQIIVEFPSTTKEPSMSRGFSTRTNSALVHNEGDKDMLMCPSGPRSNGSCINWNPKENITVFNANTPYMYGTDTGFGVVDFVSYIVAQRNTNFGTRTHQNLKSMTYSFPSITYTVASTTNTPHLVTYERSSSVTDTSATIHWTYTDIDNDPQTAWQVQIATDSAFSNIIKAHAGSDASLQTPTSGLTPETTYYVRVRAFNNTNAWSEWDTGSFTTTCTSDQCPSANPLSFACSPDRGTIDVANGSQTVRFTSDSISDTTGYRWTYNGITRSTPSNSINITYQQDGTNQQVRTEQVRVQVEGSSRNYAQALCQVSVTDSSINSCPNTPNLGDPCGCDNRGTIQCGGSCSISACTDTEPVISEYDLNPNIVEPNGTCPVYVEARNVSSCTLSKQGSPLALPLPDPSGMLSIPGTESVNTGVWRLTCVGASDGVVVDGGIKQCLTNFNVREG